MKGETRTYRDKKRQRRGRGGRRRNLVQRLSGTG